MNNNRKIIVIESEFCSRADEIAAALGQRLQLPCFGQEILSLAAEHSGISEKLLRRYDGRMCRSAYDLTAEDASGLKIPMFRDFAAAKMEACRSLARENKGCILVDRHADAALKDVQHIRIFLHAEAAAREEFYKNHVTVLPPLRRLPFARAEGSYRQLYKSVDRSWGLAASYDLVCSLQDASPEENGAMLSDIIGRYLSREEAS